MMRQDAQIIDFNRELVKFMRDNPGAYISIKDNRCVQLMFEEDVNDEKHVAAHVSTHVSTHVSAHVSIIEEEVQLSNEV